MVRDSWTEDDWNSLLHLIQYKRCILMLGPDASAEEINGQWKPLPEQLANSLYEELVEERRKYVISNNLAQVAQAYYWQEQRVYHNLLLKTEKFYRRKQQSASNVFYEKLATLPFRLIIVSTPDELFYNVLKVIQENTWLEYYNFRGKKKELEHEFSEDSPPLVYQLYGNFKEPNSLVLTEDDLLTFLVHVIQGVPQIPSEILHELRDPNNSLLFLGFGFHQHWYLRILLHVLQGPNTESFSSGFSSFALEQYTPDETTILFFDQRRPQIKICQQDFRKFVGELKQRYDKLKSRSEQVQLAVRQAPSLFDAKIYICAADDSKEQFQALFQKLDEVDCPLRYNLIERKEKLERDLKDIALDQYVESKKIRNEIELLKDKLSGNPLSSEEYLKDAILYDKIDYVIAVQSPEMIKQYHQNGSRCNQLIQYALQQQNEKPNRTFLIPVTINANSKDLLESQDLSHKPIDISDNKNIQIVIKKITQDWQRRKRRA